MLLSAAPLAGVGFSFSLRDLTASSTKPPDGGSSLSGSTSAQVATGSLNLGGFYSGIDLNSLLSISPGRLYPIPLDIDSTIGDIVEDILPEPLAPPPALEPILVYPDPGQLPPVPVEPEVTSDPAVPVVDPPGPPTANDPASAEKNDAEVTITLVATDADGNVLESLDVGQSFVLRVYAEQTGGFDDTNGVFAAFTNVLLDSDLLQFTGGLRFAPGTWGLSSGAVARDGLHGVGAGLGGLTPTGTGPHELFSVEMVAARGGTTTICTAHDDQLGHEILVYGEDDRVGRERTTYGSLTLNIVGERETQAPIDQPSQGNDLPPSNPLDPLPELPADPTNDDPTVSNPDVADAAVSITMIATDADGNVLESVEVGESFIVHIYAEQTSGFDESCGVFTAYTDLSFNSTLLDPTGDVHFADGAWARSSGTHAAGGIRGVGAAVGGFGPTGKGAIEVCSIEMTAVHSGTATITSGYDAQLGHGICVYGQNAEVAPERTTYGSLTINIR